MRRVERIGDTGQATVLMLGFVVLAALVVGLIFDVSAILVARQRLQASADAAALAGATAVDEAWVRGEAALILDPSAARSHVLESLARSHVDRQVAHIGVTGDRVHVGLADDVDLVFLSTFGVSPQRVEAGATARPRVG